jgi:hypothetical protein
MGFARSGETVISLPTHRRKWDDALVDAVPDGFLVVIDHFSEAYVFFPRQSPDTKQSQWWPPHGQYEGAPTLRPLRGRQCREWPTDE